MKEKEEYKDSLYGKLRDKDVEILKKRFSVRYWIVINNHPSDFPIVYQNKDYKVLSLN